MIIKIKYITEIKHGLFAEQTANPGVAANDCNRFFVCQQIICVTHEMIL